MSGSIDNMADVFKALGDSTRLNIIKMLLSKGNNLCVGMLARKLGISQPAVSQQLKVLKSAGLVKAARDGFHMHYKVLTGATEKLGVDITELFRDAGTDAASRDDCEFKGSEERCAEIN